MAQYFELAARQMVSEGNRASGRGDHAEANRLWAEAAKIGTRIPEEPTEPAIARDATGHVWITDGDRDWRCRDHDNTHQPEAELIKWGWDLIIADAVPPLEIELL